MPYPPPHANLILDIISKDQFGIYAIELKVESANNAGAQIINGINADRIKIANYPAQNPGARWVVGLGYSNGALQAMQAFANIGGNMTIYGFVGGIGVTISTV